MSHPHPPYPGPQGLPNADDNPHDEHGVPDLLPSEPVGNARRWTVLGVLAAVVIFAAVWLTWDALRSKDEARTATKAAQAACSQVQNNGQKCATDPAEVSAGLAVAPAAPTSIGPLPRTSGGSRSSGAPDETAAQAGQPGGPMVNPGDERIVGLTLRAGRLEVTYADGTVVDAGRVDGAPPPIVVVVPESPAASAAVSSGASSSGEADGTSAPPTTDQAPPWTEPQTETSTP